MKLLTGIVAPLIGAALAALAKGPRSTSALENNYRNATLLT